MSSIKKITSWLMPPNHSRGLDPLGVQAPAINIYGQLLPGITNVTDRARYYSFYPWMIRAFERKSTKTTYEALREWVRRSDCLFTMIGIRHGQQVEDGDFALHAKALIGSNTLTSVVQNMDENSKVKLEVFTTLEDSHQRYFKNQLGGLKQYYIGTFDGLELMTRQGRGVANTHEVGIPMAHAMESFVNSNLFIQTINSGMVTTGVLDELAGFCPCQLTASNDEHSALLDLFFARNHFDDESGRQRRSTLGLILNLIQAVADCREPDVFFAQDIFRACVYTNALPDGSTWSLPPGLEETRKQWRVYQKHELLSAAIQSIFWVALRMIEESSEIFWSTGDFMAWFSEQQAISDAVTNFEGQSFTSTLRQIRKTLPDLQDWLNEEHEMQLVRSALDDCNENQPGVYSSILENASRVILALCAREDFEAEAYAPLQFTPDFLRLYPLNLQAMRQNSDSTWHKMLPNNWLAWIAGLWGIEAHFRVALRKLRFQNKDTLHILPTDRGLVVQEMPGPTYTSPRFTQGIQILHDLGAISRKDQNQTGLTPLGQTLREETHV